MFIKERNHIMTTISYAVPSVHCGHCKMTIEREVGEMAGVQSVKIGRAHV